MIMQKMQLKDKIKGKTEIKQFLLIGNRDLGVTVRGAAHKRAIQTCYVVQKGLHVTLISAVTRN